MEWCVRTASVGELPYLPDLGVLGGYKKFYEKRAYSLLYCRNGVCRNAVQWTSFFE